MLCFFFALEHLNASIISYVDCLDSSLACNVSGADVITAMDEEEKCDDNTEDPCGVNTVVPLIVSNEVQQSDGVFLYLCNLII